MLTRFRIHLSQSVPFAPGDAAALASGAHVISTHVKNGLRRVHLAVLDELSTRPNADHVAKGTRTLWKARAPSVSDLKPQKRISCVLPLGLDDIVMGYCASPPILPISVHYSSPSVLQPMAAYPVPRSPVLYAPYLLDRIPQVQRERCSFREPSLR